MKQQHSKTKRIFFISIYVFFYIIVFPVSKVFAQTREQVDNGGQVGSRQYQNIVEGLPVGGSGGFGGILQQIFIWGVGLTATLAVLMLVVGGIQYMGSESLFAKDEGKQRMMAALGGLLIALTSVLILSTIFGGGTEAFKVGF
ncbi:hypothetical protein N9L18_00105 [Candidatus Pacebacteria bacterium]|nr:hypothetical protein [Candidatus Paceibacterota bacterium]